MKTEDLNFINPEKLYLVIRLEYIQSESNECEFTKTFDHLKLFFTREEAKEYMKTCTHSFNMRCVETSFEEMNKFFER